VGRLVLAEFRWGRGVSSAEEEEEGKEEGEEQQEEEEAVFISVVNTNEDPPNAGGGEGGGGGGLAVFTRENRGASAQHATRAIPIRSSHGPMRA